ncbi:T9SS type A sorting domain-containing protein [Halpernia sp.]|uniref:T9SS type A sorting domain-containing protein n=1 Tax=Halpernia sp. TaxID=2782209 RepID=UPI003A94BB92
MKKLLFSLFATAGIVFSVNAQTTKISFESSEGYVLGELVGQNNDVSSFYDTDIDVMDTAEISDEKASDGTYSVKIIDYSDGGFGGIFLTSLNSYDRTSISFNVFVPSLNGSDNIFDLYDEDGNFAVEINLDPDGNFQFAGANDTDYTPIGTYLANKWNKIELKIDYTASTMKILLNGVVIHTTSYDSGGVGIGEIDLANTSGGTDTYYDNIVIQDLDALATSEVSNSKNKVRVFPNPVSDVLNLDSTDKVELMQLFDASGKLIKTFRNPEKSANVSNLKKGIYVLKVKTDKGTSSTKIIKK